MRSTQGRPIERGVRGISVAMALIVTCRAAHGHTTELARTASLIGIELSTLVGDSVGLIGRGTDVAEHPGSGAIPGDDSVPLAMSWFGVATASERGSLESITSAHGDPEALHASIRDALLGTPMLAPDPLPLQKHDLLSIMPPQRVYIAMENFTKSDYHSSSVAQYPSQFTEWRIELSGSSLQARTSVTTQAGILGGTNSYTEQDSDLDGFRFAVRRLRSMTDMTALGAPIWSAAVMYDHLSVPFPGEKLELDSFGLELSIGWAIPWHYNWLLSVEAYTDVNWLFNYGGTKNSDSGLYELGARVALTYTWDIRTATQKSCPQLGIFYDHIMAVDAKFVTGDDLGIDQQNTYEFDGGGHAFGITIGWRF